VSKFANVVTIEVVGKVLGALGDCVIEFDFDD